MLCGTSQRGCPDSRSGPTNPWRGYWRDPQKLAATVVDLEGFHPTSAADSWIQYRKRGACSKPWPNLLSGEENVTTLEVHQQFLQGSLSLV